MLSPPIGWKTKPRSWPLHRPKKIRWQRPARHLQHTDIENDMFNPKAFFTYWTSNLLIKLNIRSILGNLLLWVSLRGFFQNLFSHGGAIRKGVLGRQVWSKLPRQHTGSEQSGGPVLQVPFCLCFHFSSFLASSFLLLFFSLLFRLALTLLAANLQHSAHWCPPCRSFTPVLASSFR